MNVFLSSFLYYAVAANIVFLVLVLLSRKRVAWTFLEYPLIYLPWLLMFAIAHFTFENPADGLMMKLSFLPFLSVVGGVIAGLMAILRIIWPKAEIGAFPLSCGSATLMSVLYMKFLALFFIFFVD